MMKRILRNCSRLTLAALMIGWLTGCGGSGESIQSTTPPTTDNGSTPDPTPECCRALYQRGEVA
ncbi:hypothetical protein [Pseudoalteromonas sp. S16_S37]|uniref:hypothetical protein n=1 Tax=Pseudoalteromonas sp. S16_S37 TaxID=2720228 RepID=UPI001680F266|nr:hypothetical protein [Pseudoalteromonas sp. S16_S37]MBD1584723.1 hypothetical protein [Pseudoalteromonas sp. S16_S37]